MAKSTTDKPKRQYKRREPAVTKTNEDHDTGTFETKTDRQRNMTIKFMNDADRPTGIMNIHPNSNNSAFKLDIRGFDNPASMARLDRSGIEKVITILQGLLDDPEN